MARYYYFLTSFLTIRLVQVITIVKGSYCYVVVDIPHSYSSRGQQHRRNRHGRHRHRNAIIGDNDDGTSDKNIMTSTKKDVGAGAGTTINNNSCRIKEPSLFVRCPDYPNFAYYGKGKVTRRVSLVKGKDNNNNNNSLDDDDNTTTTERKFGAFASSSSSRGTTTTPTTTTTSRLFLMESDFNFFRDSAKKTRLLDRRSYASWGPFEKENIYEPPTLDDLRPPPFPFEETLWISTPYRILTFAVAYYIFPYCIGFLNNYTTMEPDLLSDITSIFAPGVSVLYGTFIALTLSILYDRQKDIQNDAAVEASLLALITRNLLNIFRCDRNLSIEVGQSCADQIRILAKGSRGSELLAIMYSDPYARMLEIIDDREYYLMNNAKNRDGGELGGEAVPIGSCRQILEDLYKIRADRLSDESLALPPTHFFIMTVLTGLILLGYAINVLPTVNVAIEGGRPSNESALIFGLLTTVYVIFYNFAQDLNNPFSGLYQIRRSSTAAHLLQAKWLLVNNPFTRDEIDFDEPGGGGLSSSLNNENNNNSEDVLIRTPGIGEMLFTRDEIYPDDVTPPPTTDTNINNTPTKTTTATE